MTETEVITRDLRRWDKATLSDRVARAAELNEHSTDSGMLFAGGHVVFIAYRSAQSAYMHGLWVPALLSALVAMQRHLAALLHIRGINPPNAPSELIEAAKTKGIDAETCARLTEAFSIGVLYQQFQEPETELIRFVGRGSDMEHVMEGDARTIMHIMMDYFTAYCVI